MDSVLATRTGEPLRAEPLTRPEVEERVLHLIEPLLATQHSAYWLEGRWNPRDVVLQLERIGDVPIGTGMQLGHHRGKKILGEYDFRQNAVRLDAVLDEEHGHPRRVWVFWHECIGHAWLQGDWVRSQLSDLADAPTAMKDDDDSIMDFDRAVFEVQANWAAATASAPRTLLEQAMWKHFDTAQVIYGGRGCEFVSSLGRTPSNAFDLARMMGRELSASFGGLSAVALARRLLETGLLVDPALARTRKVG